MTNKTRAKLILALLFANIVAIAYPEYYLIVICYVACIALYNLVEN